MDDVERAIWLDVKIEDNECWTWYGPKVCDVLRLLGELAETPLPSHTRLYRMPECSLGAECVNPEHVGSAEQWMEHQKGTE